MPAHLTAQEHAIRLAERQAKAWEGTKDREFRARQSFYDAVRQAHQAGATYRAIGDALGFSFSRICQIVKEGNERSES